MAKKYSRKQLGNLDDLDVEQAKLKVKARQIEGDWISNILNPQQLAIGLVGNIISKKAAKSSKGKNSILKIASDPNAANLAVGLLRQPLLKKIGLSFVRWQMFNLAWFLGKRIVKKMKANRMKRK